jgi:hypothetical protein
MNRAVFGAIGIIVAVTLGACIDDEVSLYIKQNNLPGKGCVASSGGESLASGLLDVNTRVGLGYYMFPTLVNNMIGTSSMDKQPERNNLQMRRFEVSLDLGGYLNVDPGALEFVIPQSGMIQAGEEAVFGPIPVIDDHLAADLGASLCSKSKASRPVIAINLRAVADRGSETCESAEFIFPITLCCGCLVDWRMSAPATGDSSVDKNECGAPQDSRVTCFAGAGGIPVCLRNSNT